MMIKTLFFAMVARRLRGRIICLDSGWGGPLLRAGWLGMTVELVDGDVREVPYCDIDHIMHGPDVDRSFNERRDQVKAGAFDRQPKTSPAINGQELQEMLSRWSRES